MSWLTGPQPSRPPAMPVPTATYQCWNCGEDIYICPHGEWKHLAGASEEASKDCSNCGQLYCLDQNNVATSIMAQPYKSNR